MASTWTKSPGEIIKDLIAASNPAFDAVRAAFNLGAVSTHSGAENRNSTLTVSPVNEAVYTGDVGIFYDRLALSAYGAAVIPTGSIVWGAVEGQTKVDADTDAETLRALLNSALGLNLGSGDFTSLSIAEVTAGTEYTISATVSGTCLLFTGTYSLTVTQSADAIPTNTIITTTTLTGLDLPVA